MIEIKMCHEAKDGVRYAIHNARFFPTSRRYEGARWALLGSRGILVFARVQDGATAACRRCGEATLFLPEPGRHRWPSCGLYGPAVSR